MAYLQSEQSECGLVCLAIVAAEHGLRLDLATLRRRFSVSSKGMDLSQLMGHSQALGLGGRAVRLELNELCELQPPCILHWDLNHFVVLKQVRSDSIVIADPAHGEKRVPMSEVSKRFTGVALELAPTPEFRPQDLRRRMRLRDLTGRTRGLGRALAQIVVLALVLEVVSLLTPMVTQWVIDGALVSADRDLLLVVVMGGGLLVAFDFLLRMARGWLSLRLNQQLSVQWAGNLFLHLMRLPMSFFEKRNLGDITSRFTSLAAIQRVLTEGAIEAVMDGCMAAVTLAMMLLYSPPLAGIAIAAMAIYAALRFAAYGPLRDASEERIVLAAKENSYFLETLRAMQPLKLFNRIPDRFARRQNLLVDVQNRDLRIHAMELLFGNLNALIFGLEGMVLLYVGGRAVLDMSLTQGMLLAFLAYKLQFDHRAGKLIDLGISVRMLGLHAQRVSEIALEPPEPQPETEPSTAHLEPRIELQDVGFRYADGEPWVLRHLNLTVEPGESLAIVGPSGCGKTTLLKLMLGLLQPTEGDIKVGGVSIRQLGTRAYWTLVGTVMQEDQLLAGSLAENIACFDPRADHRRTEAAARLAQMHEDITAMPMGYHTLVGELGTALSGGQKQRLLLARALYKKPKILALDEATSHLDLTNERKVNLAIQALHLTRVIIAHRAETIASAARVVALKGGRVIADVRHGQPGKPNGLMPGHIERVPAMSQAFSANQPHP